MKILQKHFLFIYFFLSLLACNKTIDKQISTPEINDLADIYVHNYYIRFHPEKGTLINLPNPNNYELWIPTESRIFEERAAEDSLYKQLIKIDPDLMTELDQTTYYNLRERLEASKGLRICNQYLWSFNYLEGFQYDLERLANIQMVNNESDKKALIERWSKVPKLIEVEISNNSKGLEQGYTLPSQAIEILITQISNYIDMPVEESIFFQAAIGNSDLDFQRKLRDVIEKCIYPSYSKLKTYLQEVYLPQSRKNFSILNIPDGSECYLAYVRDYTSLDLTKNRLIGIGDSLFLSNERRFLELGKEIYGEDNQGVILKKFHNDPENYFADYNELEDQLNSSFDLSQRELTKFLEEPPSEPLVVKRVPKNKEGIDSNAFYEEALREGDTATMYIDYLSQSKAPKGNLETMVFHEGIPGHHLQSASSDKLKNTHPFNRLIWNAGYGEGWATYAESVAEEMGWYSSPKSILTQYFYTTNENIFLNNFLMYKEHELEKLYEIYEKKYNMNKLMTDNQFTYSTTLLGYLLSYGIGNSYIRKLRIYAESELGENFNLKEFHKECLRHGNIPLTHLERVINRWIEGKRE